MVDTHSDHLSVKPFRADVAYEFGSKVDGYGTVIVDSSRLRLIITAEVEYVVKACDIVRKPPKHKRITWKQYRDQVRLDCVEGSPFIKLMD